MTEIILTTTCPFCGQISQIKVYEEDYVRWQEGELIQNCFPYLNATQREILISHICPSCQRTIFQEV